MDATLESVATSVAQLTDAVAELRSQGDRPDPLTREKVEQIVSEVTEAQRAAAPEQNRRSGFHVEDTEGADAAAPKLRGKTHRERMEEILTRSAKEVAPALRGVSASDVEEFQRRSDTLVLIATAQGVDARETSYFAEEYLPMARAMDTQTATEGQEFVPKALSGSLIERVNLELLVAAQFPVVPMPTPTFDIPAKSVSRQRTGSLAENTADSGQATAQKRTPNTRKVTLIAKKLAGEILVSKEAEEDSIIAIMPFIEEELVEWLAADIEDAIVNGDTTATHQDNDTTAANDPRKIWDGLRKFAPAGAKFDATAAALSTAQLRKNRKGMGKYGVRPADLRHLLSINAYVDLLSDSNVQTIDKYGTNATLVTGELGRIDGTPIIVSEYVRTDLDATGVNSATGANNVKTEAITFHTRSCVRGTRRGLTLQRLVELYAEADQDALLATLRQGFVSRFPSSEPTVAVSYNVLR